MQHMAARQRFCSRRLSLPGLACPCPCLPSRIPPAFCILSILCVVSTISGGWRCWVTTRGSNDRTAPKQDSAAAMPSLLLPAPAPPAPACLPAAACKAWPASRIPPAFCILSILLEHHRVNIGGADYGPNRILQEAAMPCLILLPAPPVFFCLHTSWIGSAHS